MAELLKPGAPAPDGTFISKRERLTLGELKGRKNIVLAFYPAAFTNGCERELRAFQTRLPDFDAQNAQIIASSVDADPSQQAFAQHCGLEFKMAADFPQHALAKAFGVYNEERGTNRRVTFVIDKEGVIRHVIEDSQDMDRHSKESLEILKSLK